MGRNSLESNSSDSFDSSEMDSSTNNEHNNTHSGNDNSNITHSENDNSDHLCIEIELIFPVLTENISTKRRNFYRGDYKSANSKLTDIYKLGGYGGNEC